MKPIPFIALVSVVAAISFAAPSVPSPKPNILILLADDVGFSDLGCYGGEIRTPRLDALAAGGLRFTQFYNCARCCPSRASLLTGLYPHETGVGFMTSDDGEQFPGYRGALNNHCVTIAQVLKSAGYRTAALGKWHVGDHELPTSRGFDDFYGFYTGYAVDSWEPRMMIRLPEGKPARSYKPGEFFATDAITDHAIDFLGDLGKSGSPWFMYVAYQAAHFPVQSKPQDMTGYPELYAAGWDAIREQRLARQKKMGLVTESTVLTPRSRIPHIPASKRIGSITLDHKNPPWDSLLADRRADLAQRMAVYAGMVSGMDRNIGRILDALRAGGQFDNTLIIFLSDNGACAEWEPYGFEMVPTENPQPGHGIGQGTQLLPNKLYQHDELSRMGGAGSFPSYGSGWANASNTPWRLYKHYDHEGGIATPFIVSWPAKISVAGGRWVNEPSHLIDLMATCVDLGGAAYPENVDGHEIAAMEGRSLAPLLSDSTNVSVPNRMLFWEHEGNAAVRWKQWKLVRMGQSGSWELYDMSVDRTELHDLATENPGMVRELKEKWDAWAARTHVTPAPTNGKGRPPSGAAND